MKINKYPDGTSYIKVPDYGISNAFIFKVNTYEDLWHLNQIVDAWNFRYKKKPTITIPNLIDAQADKRFNDDESSGLKLVCEFLNRMKANFYIFHPHNPEVVEALMDNVEIIDNSKFIRDVLCELAPGPGFLDTDKLNNITLMSSDAGGFKPLMKLCDKINWQGETFSASKFRSQYQANNKGEGSTKLIQVVDKEDFEGKDILIIDDICVYGGTFKGLSNLLADKNIGKLYLAVSHITIQNHKNDNVFHYFDKVFTTNSKFDNYFIGDGMGGTQPLNLEIIKMF